MNVWSFNCNFPKSRSIYLQKNDQVRSRAVVHLCTTTICFLLWGLLFACSRKWESHGFWKLLYSIVTTANHAHDSVLPQLKHAVKIRQKQLYHFLTELVLYHDFVTSLAPGYEAAVLGHIYRNLYSCQS
jgi:hypothetical protein